MCWRKFPERTLLKNLNLSYRDTPIIKANHVEQTWKVFEALPSQTEGPGHRLQPGDWILVRNYGRKRNLEPRFVGPFQVQLATRTAVRLHGRRNWVHATHTKRVPLPLPSDTWMRRGLSSSETDTPQRFVPFSEARLVSDTVVDSPQTISSTSTLENLTVEQSPEQLNTPLPSNPLFEDQTHPGSSRYFLRPRTSHK
ncbi:uncharacterized protein LOC144805716 isoform X1 [Lissotriton helveticus]